jgi:predicted dehydrogenase
MNEVSVEQNKLKISLKPRLAFLGVGWIGRDRLEAIASGGHAEIVFISDTDIQNSRKAAFFYPEAKVVQSYDEILVDASIDGIVIATPSAMHAEQSVKALQAGKAVFCQKPLARNLAETQMVVDTARISGKLLAVDFSYRYTNAMKWVYELIHSEELGSIYSIQLTFHNAYGPDKSWFYDPAQSGGGCLMDLGIHLIDLALWVLDFPEVTRANSRLFYKGQPLEKVKGFVEDYAFSSIDLEGEIHLNLNCSWNLPAGRDAVIEAIFYGTKGGVAFKNINGSFYEFSAERFWGTKTELLYSGNDQWGGKAGINWSRRLASGEGFDPENKQLIKIASLIDTIYGRQLTR